MTLDVLGELNWLAVLVAAFLYFGLGALWYTPIMFGDQWTLPSAGTRALRCR